MAGRGIATFIPVVPPLATSVSLVADKVWKNGVPVPYVTRSAALVAARELLRPHVTRLKPVHPLAGSLRERVRILWPQGALWEDVAGWTAMLNDLLVECRVITSTKDIEDLCVTKGRAATTGVYLRIEEIRHG